MDVGGTLTPRTLVDAYDGEGMDLERELGKGSKRDAERDLGGTREGTRRGTLKGPQERLSSFHPSTHARSKARDHVRRPDVLRVSR
jgi:hypothetical protein